MMVSTDTSDEEAVLVVLKTGSSASSKKRKKPKDTSKRMESCEDFMDNSADETANEAPRSESGFFRYET